jgi:hypothetical protein
VETKKASDASRSSENRVASRKSKSTMIVKYHNNLSLSAQTPSEAGVLNRL